MADARLSRNHREDDAHHRVAPEWLKYLVTQMVGAGAGGTQNYCGWSLVGWHRDLSITSDEWSAFLDDLQQTLDKFAVPPEEQAELKTIVDSTRSEIVVGETAVELSA